MQGFELRHVSEKESKGTFLFDILSDRIEEKDMKDPDQAELSPFGRTNSVRYWFRGRTEQKLPGKIIARLDADVVSDQDYLKEFRENLSGFESRPDLETYSGRPVEEINSPYKEIGIKAQP